MFFGEVFNYEIKENEIGQFIANLNNKNKYCSYNGGYFDWRLPRIKEVQNMSSLLINNIKENTEYSYLLKNDRNDFKNAYEIAGFHNFMFAGYWTQDDYRLTFITPDGDLYSDFGKAIVWPVRNCN